MDSVLWVADFASVCFAGFGIYGLLRSRGIMKLMWGLQIIVCVYCIGLKRWW
jgi:hypothetical protein